MDGNEERRFQLHQRLDEVLGRDDANTLMEHLPPVGWSDLATKQDLEHLRVSTTHHLDQLRAQMVHEFELRDARFDRVDQRFDTFRLEMKADLERALRLQTFALVGLMFTMLSAFLALQQSVRP